MIPREPCQFWREYAQLCCSFSHLFHGSNNAPMVSTMADASGRKLGGMRLNRYPSPSRWSGPLWVRPPLSHRIIHTKIRRQHADLVRFSVFSFDFFRQNGFLSGRGRRKEGRRACGSRRSRYQSLRQRHLRAAAIPLQNNRWWVPGQGPGRLPSWTATLPLARLSGRPATSPIATNTQSAADTNLTIASGQPDAAKNAGRAPCPPGVFVMPASQLRGPRPRSEGTCSRKS